MILLKKDHFNILITLKTSGYLSSKSHIYSTIFIPAIQNYNLFLKTVTSTLSKSVKTTFNF